jgi:uncharacterized protein
MTISFRTGSLNGRFSGRRMPVVLGSIIILSLLATLAHAQDFRQHTAAVPMADGIHLQADVYLPPGEGPFPAVLIRTPYGRSGYETFYAPHFTGAGYALVVQSARGTAGSEGRFIPFAHERRDGFDTADWLAAQPWSSGRIGLYGPSYSSYAGLVLAAERHPAVAAVVNVSGWGELAPMLFPGGAFHLQLNIPWNLHQFGLLRRDTDWDALFRHVPITDAIRLPDGSVHPAWQASTRLFAPGPGLAAMGLGDRPIEVPVLHLTGWHDFTYHGTLDAYAHVARHADVPQRLVVGPWHHDQQKTLETRVGDEDFGPAAALGWDGMHALAIGWFDQWMKGGASAAPPGDAPVRLFVMGRNEWADFDAWPPADAAPVRWYLAASGALQADRPQSGATDSFTYDPEDPVPTAGGVLFHFFPDELGPRDQRAVQARRDVLVYTSEPLTEAVELVGPLRAVLHVSADRADADFTAKLTVVRPDGYARIIEDGIVRSQYREGLDRPAPLSPGEVVRLDIGLGATALYVPAGDRLRVEISGGSFPKYDRNPGDATPSMEATRFVPIRQTLHLGGDRSSYVEVYARPAR